MPSFSDPPDGGKAAIRPPLRLVHPAPPPTPKIKRPRHEGTVFTAEESARLRAALKNARAMFGTWACLADAMHARKSAVQAAGSKYRVSAAIAVRLARALGRPLESLYRAPADASRCPRCGRGGAS